ncbi:monocyte chemotactic protein 1B-like [Trematomus bernacchii]|uniref:monocyte chemotactic protein 1B-like n=1 Tax=Trematomus bernacchii TaxID=40690 RepID=UPI00146C2E03|nr:monocyte chemotactic protein 1B-like [Trematomus bernacchii]
MTNLVFVSLLLITILVSTASAQGGIASCCRKLSKTQVQRENLMDYYKQNKSACPINAVVFTTRNNKRICSDPKKMWTLTCMAYIDGKNSQLQRLT